MRFRCAAASVAALACLAAAPALAASPCDGLERYVPTAKTALRSPEPKVRNDIPYNELKTIPGATRASLLGLTQFARATDHSYEVETIDAPDGNGVCVALREVNLAIVHTILRIFIADHVHEGSCTYDVTMLHERDHVAYERGALKKALLEIRKEIAKPARWVHGDAEAEALKTIERRIDKWSKTLLKRATKVAKRGHGYLDIQSNIRGSLAKCPRWQRK